MKEDFDYYEDEDDDGFEMPTPCMCCKEVFDLHDGVSHKNTIYCETCGERFNKIEELENEIEELNIEIANAEVTITDNRMMIEEKQKEIEVLRN